MQWAGCPHPKSGADAHLLPRRAWQIGGAGYVLVGSSSRNQPLNHHQRRGCRGLGGANGGLACQRWVLLVGSAQGADIISRL
jgi:hypothetical protein